jgi:cytoskeletal protein RodZ
MTGQVGRSLSDARQAKSLRLEEAAEAIHIRKKYLEALEAEDWDALPSIVQARGFLRSYAAYLGVDLNAIGDRFVLEETLPDEGQIESVTAQVDVEKGESATDIFSQVGQTFKERRELLGFSLEDIERQTHIRMHYLHAIESGEIDSLPSVVQGRGMLSNYAEFLDLPADQILLQFAEGLQTQLTERTPSGIGIRRRRAPRRPPSWMKNFLSFDILFIGLLVIGLASFVIWSWARFLSVKAEIDPTPSAPSIADILLPSPTHTITPTAPIDGAATVINFTAEAGGDEVTPEVTLPVSEQASIQIYIVVRQRAWLKVVADDVEVFNGRVIPGSAHSFSANQKIELKTGNAAAFQIFYNQEDLGPLGIYGEVAEVVFSVEGFQTPTPTVTTTPTVTITPTITTTPTATP